MIAGGFEPAATERVAVPGQQPGVEDAAADAAAEDVVLVDALSQLAIPDPATSELVPMADVLDHLARKDDEIRELNERLQRAMLELGRLQAQSEAQQRLLAATDSDRTQPEADRTEPDTAGHDHHSWWQRWLRRRLL